jgi:hypothetical protein
MRLLSLFLWHDIPVEVYATFFRVTLRQGKLHVQRVNLVLLKRPWRFILAD